MRIARGFMSEVTSEFRREILIIYQQAERSERKFLAKYSNVGICTQRSRKRKLQFGKYTGCTEAVFKHTGVKLG